MSYLDDYSTRINSPKGDYSSRVEKKTIDFMNKHFKETPAYREATITKLDETQEQLDIREVNVSKSAEDKKLYVRPNTKVEVGSYITFENKFKDTMIYMVTEFQENLLSPCAVSEYCNQTVRWKGFEKGIPAIFTDSSYGSKGRITNILQFPDFDSRGIVRVQRNASTEIITEGFRFILGSEWDIYTVTKKKGVKSKGIWELTVQYTKTLQEDDFENNIAFNKLLDQELSVIDTVIIGEETIVKGNTVRYKINDNSEVDKVIWSIDEDSLTYGTARIDSQTDTYCDITGLIAGEGFVLTATSEEGIVLATMNIIVRQF